jgi:hypothetical protein
MCFPVPSYHYNLKAATDCREHHENGQSHGPRGVLKSECEQRHRNPSPFGDVDSGICQIT